MKKIIALALAASAFIVPATAEASVSGARTALIRELRFDYGQDGGRVWPHCTQQRRNYYTCTTVLVIDHLPSTLVDVRARVWQYGSRYIVDYRFGDRYTA